MREEFCGDARLEIYHLFLIDKDIYQQPNRKADGKEVRRGQPLSSQDLDKAIVRPFDPQGISVHLIIFHPQQKTHHGNIDEDFMYHLSTLGT